MKNNEANPETTMKTATQALTSQKMQEAYKTLTRLAGEMQDANPDGSADDEIRKLLAAGEVLYEAAEVAEGEEG